MQVKRIKTEQRRMVRHRNREMDGNILRLSLTTEKFNQLCDRTGDEISLNGTMYDIVSYKKEGDTVRCFVVEDKTESELHRQYSKNIEQKQQRTPKPIVFFWLYASNYRITLPAVPLFMPLATPTPKTSDKTSCGYKRYISQPPEDGYA